MSLDSRVRLLEYVVALFYSVVVAVLWIPAWLFRKAGQLFREMGTDGWQRADGVITGGSVSVIHGWVVDHALGRLDYSYRVHGHYYAGSVTRQYPDEQAAWNYVDARRNKTVLIRYRDGQAEVSVLRDVDQDYGWQTVDTPQFLDAVWQHWKDELRPERSSRIEVEDADDAE